MRSFRPFPIFVAVLVGVVAYFATTRDAGAVPSFARKYQTSCQTCHTVFPALNPFGEAFRRNGYRFPSQGGSTDMDQVKSAMIPLGQEEYEQLFPNAVWPDKIVEAVPLSLMANGQVAINMPDSDAKSAAGNTFTWGGIESEFHLFAAGAFNNTLTYFSEVTLDASAGTIDVEHAYLLWNDIVGPPHLFNLWVGRLMNPSLTSFGLHSSYLNDTNMPGISIAGLYDTGAAPVIGPTAHPDGIELNGIAGHRFDYAIGWLASSTGTGLLLPDAEDVYAHVGFKIGGMSLDGEGPCGAMVPNAMKPWAETSLTVDAYAYSGLTVFDNGTGASFTPVVPVRQRDRFSAIGASARGYLGSLQLTAGAQVEHHTQPYMGTAGSPGDSTQTPPIPATYGVPDGASANSLTSYGEIDYVVYPWLVPGVRAEYTRIDLNGGSPSVDPRNGNYASLLRVVPGIATLVRPNIRVIFTGDLETAYGLPPVGSWGAAGGILVPNRFDSRTGRYAQNKLEAEQIAVTANVAF
jgi:hypothetical protein